jgi:hypothetical protein
MDVSQTGTSSLQSAQLQGLLAYLDPSVAVQSGASTNGTAFTDLVNSSQSATAGTDAASQNASGMAMLQALQNMFGTNSSDPLLDALNSEDSSNSTDPLFQASGSTNTTDPFLQALNGTDGTSTDDPFLQALDGTDVSGSSDGLDSMFTSNLSMLEALQNNQSSSAGNSSASASNSLAMLQALNANDLASL